MPNLKFMESIELVHIISYKIIKDFEDRRISTFNINLLIDFAEKAIEKANKSRFCVRYKLISNIENFSKDISSIAIVSEDILHLRDDLSQKKINKAATDAMDKLPGDLFRAINIITRQDREIVI